MDEYHSNKRNKINKLTVGIIKIDRANIKRNFVQEWKNFKNFFEINIFYLLNVVAIIVVAVLIGETGVARVTEISIDNFSNFWILPILIFAVQSSLNAEPLCLKFITPAV